MNCSVNHNNKMMKKIILINIFVIFIILVLINVSKNSVIISINSEKITLNKQAENEIIDLISLNSEKDIIIKKISGIAKVEVNGRKLKKGEELNLGKIKIDKAEKIEINVGDKQFTINTLPSTFPDYSVEGESEYDGDYYMSTFSFEYDKNHYIFKVGKNGEIKYYKKTGFVAFDFKKEYNGQKEIRYMYLQATKDNFYGLTSLLPCDLVILDENYQEINRVKYVNKDKTLSNLENHAYFYLDDNHYILTTYQPSERKTEEDIALLHCVIEEVKEGEILWEFNSKDYPELYEYSTQKGGDYMHINSIEIDKDDGNIICSFRNIDSILKLDRKTGKLMWICGGIGDEFKLSEEQKFSKQHSAISIGNNTFLLYDNGNSKGRSRILKFKLDEVNKTIKEYFEYDTELFAPMMGSIRVLDETNQTYLICYGGGPSGYAKYSVEEIKYLTNEVMFRFTFMNERMMYNVNKIK